MPKTLATLADTVPGARIFAGDPATLIDDVEHDSRAARRGTLFFCVPGSRIDGHELAPEAVARGASALVVERELEAGVPQIVVPSVREAMGPLAAAFFDHPSTALTLVGVTGTNGKTTTAFLLESVFRRLGLRAGLIGTIGTRIGDAFEPMTRTTPEAIELQRLLARMRDDGVHAVAMEVSSHGLALGRVGGAHFACSIFTNLTQDHLDFHSSMEDYFRAKALLFTPELSDHSVVNVDDPYGRRLAELTPLPTVTFGLSADAEVRAEAVELAQASSRFTVVVGGRRGRVRVPLAARYNVSNALGVIAAAHVLGYPLEEVAEGIARMGGVPGRLETIDAGQDFTVLVDYAHTPDSLENVLRSARELVPDEARLVVVFGCGGDRDRGKRPLMGRVAATLADRTIITSDNPRTEDPMAIIAAIESGARDTGRPFESIPDRRTAIESAIRDARRGDVVVIAGKGHETGQEFADHVIPFDDRDVAREILGGLVSP